MDFDKLRQWFETAQNFQGKNFWSDVFDQEYTSPMNNDLNKAGQGSTQQQLYPKVDVFYDSKEFIILIDLPAVRKEDVQLSVSGEFLYVKGTARSFYQDMQLLASERFSGTFERAIKLPEPIAKAKITAKFDYGLLQVHIVRQQKSQVHIPID